MSATAMAVTLVRRKQELISREGLISASGRNLINPNPRPRLAMKDKSSATDIVAEPRPTASTEYVLDTKIQNAKLRTASPPDFPIRKMELVYRRVCNSSPYFFLDVKAIIPSLKENLSLPIPHLSSDGR